MHLMFTVKFVVLTVAFATQCVYAKSRNGYGYFDEKFCVLEWITYLKRLSLIALMLCGVVLYYVPKSRSHARRACCILIDTVANGLKFALNIDEIKHEKIKARYENETKELRIQELYRNIYEEDTRNSQKCINKTNLDNDNHKSIRKHKSKKFRTKHTIGGKHERHRHNRHHRNAINNMLPESNAMITANRPQQITIIDEKCKKDNVIVLQDTILKTKCTISADKLKKNIDSQQENSLNKKADSSAISEIIDKSDTKKFKTSSQKQENLSNIDTNKKMQTKQNFDCMKHEEVAILSRRQSSKDCVTIVINKQMDSRYGTEKLFAKRHDGLRKKNHRLPHDVKSFTHDCCENSSITNNRVKPVLLRVVNWFFSGCPEASKRHREQINEVGKEEIFESTNTWLL
ncbi:PREDICTED: uncharacterized protein LOC108759796 isoform X2 [Trachymyrmex cornetzi]|uniref:uncharacterized protein LOC108759796 isoform X2 n=1 Tax=Trachymyrmex cornetzi TaxID=471704 RepID=UPI00084EDD24|nr:PREDICTED: uncharacterized protein LOC108759796 isoform X2 [Trachymyrmex cornetzi]